MKCSRITLFDRKEKKTKPKHICNYDQEHIFQPQLQNYLQWLNKPHSVYEEERPYLTLYNIVLPYNVSFSNDRGAQSERWINKSPRLQLAKVKNLKKSPRPEILELSEDESKLTEDEKDSELMEIQEVMEEYEIDEHVKRLIQEAAEYDQRMAEETEEKQVKERDRRKREKTPKNKTKEINNETKEKPRSKLTRTLSFSRPPSPETTQVIRVEVFSNYSMDNDCPESGYTDLESVDEQGNELKNAKKRQKNLARSNRLHTAKSLIKHQSAELTIKCQKLALSDRKANSELKNENEAK